MEGGIQGGNGEVSAGVSTGTVSWINTVVKGSEYKNDLAHK